MNKSLLKGFYSTSMECNVYYKKNFMDYYVVKLVDLTPFYILNARMEYKYKYISN